MGVCPKPFFFFPFFCKYFLKIWLKISDLADGYVSYLSRGHPLKGTWCHRVSQENLSQPFVISPTTSNALPSAWWHQGEPKIQKFVHRHSFIILPSQGTYQEIHLEKSILKGNRTWKVKTAKLWSEFWEALEIRSLCCFGNCKRGSSLLPWVPTLCTIYLDLDSYGQTRKYHKNCTICKWKSQTFTKQHA